MLLPLTPTSRLFHSVILRILHTRLLNASSLKDHTLILECFHPSTKLSTPYLLCEYLGTGSADSLSSTDLLAGTPPGAALGKMHNMYSHFRPLQPEEDHNIRRPHPAGGWYTGPSNALAEKHTEYVCQNIHLESHELFSQLCTITNLVKVGPKRGLFLTCVNIGEGITRVWRDWLADRCKSLKKRNRLEVGPNTKVEQDEEYKQRLLWADRGNNVGLRIRVSEKVDDLMPVLLRRDEDPPVSYMLEYEELVIRTTELLLVVEHSLEQEINHSGKAIVIGSWDQ